MPLSKGNYNTAVGSERTTDRLADLIVRAGNAHFDPASYAANWQLQLGTLGSGNHFIEVSLDEEDRVWLLHRRGDEGR